VQPGFRKSGFGTVCRPRLPQRPARPSDGGERASRALLGWRESDRRVAHSRPATSEACKATKPAQCIPPRWMWCFRAHVVREILRDSPIRSGSVTVTRRRDASNLSKCPMTLSIVSAKGSYASARPATEELFAHRHHFVRPQCVGRATGTARRRSASPSFDGSTRRTPRVRIKSRKLRRIRARRCRQPAESGLF